MLNRFSSWVAWTRDPELRRTQSGTAVTSFSVAVDRDYTVPERRKADRFHRCGGLAQHGGVRLQVFHQGPHGVVEGGSRSVTGKTRRATTAEVRRWLPTTSISVTADPAVPGNNGGYAQAPALRCSCGGYSAPVGGPSDFAEIDEEDGDLPF